MWNESSSPHGVSAPRAISKRAVHMPLIVLVAAGVGFGGPVHAFAPTGAGQRGSASTQKLAVVSGKVGDPSGAVIVGAKISLTPTGAGERFETTTDPKGIY